MSYTVPRQGLVIPPHTNGRPVFKGEPTLRWVIERHRHNGEVAMVGVFLHGLEEAAREAFEANIEACCGKLGVPARLRGVKEIRLVLVLTDASGYEHDTEIVDRWLEPGS